MDTNEKRIENIIVDQLGVNEDQVVPSASFVEDLGADSFDAVELVMALEEEFGISISEEDAEKFQKVGQVNDYINRLTEKGLLGSNPRRYRRAEL